MLKVSPWPALMRMLLPLMIGLLGGCTLPISPNQPVSMALADPSSTTLYRTAAERLPSDGRSGFRTLPIASYAFATRIALTKKAERTLDVQYYLFKNDDTGRALMHALGAAALRGVRVRVLIDDLYSTGEDKILLDLASYPNLEVRLFNPFAGGRGSTLSRLTGAIFDLDRIDQRMHNKLFIADNAMALAGGRNIADEYFMDSQSTNFVDLDLFVAGPAVRALSGAFDRYWNSDRVYPIKSFYAPTADTATARAEFQSLSADATGPALDEQSAEYLRFETLPSEIMHDHLESLVIASAEVVVDDPDKPRSVDNPNFPTVTRTVLAKMNAAHDQVEIISPYFIPGETGMAMMDGATKGQGRITIFTNSLASTDAPLAEYGYMKYRKRILEDQIDLYELSPTIARDRNRLGPFKHSLASLHAKCVVIDDRFIFLGSMNLDHRSADENTEVGLIVDSPELVHSLDGLLDRDSFYHLQLDQEGDIEWVAHKVNGGPATIYHTDPETTWWQRFEPRLTGPFVPEDQL
jgi:phosphatidylserine/phosphatidylglycerophosphate/cardiolipin synthase-like enzyme